jgi:anthranilate synthase/aminodeoxychorismate synthase-like glutamine amidotransferase
MLQHYLLELHPDVRVWKNDEINASDLQQLNPQRIILSPGPCRPETAGNMMDIIASFHQQTPILGVCLGHQALGQFFGAKLERALQPMHGKTSEIFHEGRSVFKDLPNPIKVMRYHSLLLKETKHTDLLPLAYTPDKELMAFRHQKYPCTGIQFHPESIKTEYGKEMLLNWATEL